MSDVPVPVEQTKVEVTETPAVLAAGEPAKTEETPAVIETPAAIVETPVTNTLETAATEDTKKEDAKPAETEKTHKGPGILAKLIAPFKAKGPRSPKKAEKKKEAETPAIVEEASKPEETLATDAAAEPPKEVAEPVVETETPEAETPAETPAAVDAPKEEKKEEKKSKSKFTRRISYHVGDFFKKSKSEVPTTAKVNELPPKIDEPTFVAPLENPASEGSVPAETPAEPSEPAKPVEPAAVTTPVVAAAA